MMYKFPRRFKNTSGKTGVKYDKRRDVYVAKMSVNGKELTRQFKTFEQAANQRDSWEEEYKIKAEV